MSREQETVMCENPQPGKAPTRIPRWKYEAVELAIMAVVRESEGGVPFQRLADEVRSRLAHGELEQLGSVTWYTVVVKLDLESKGRLERVPGRKPQIVRLPSSG